MKAGRALFVVSSLALLSACALAQTDEQSIRNLYARLGRAFKERDIAAVEALEASGFTYARTEFDNPPPANRTVTLNASRANKKLAKEAALMASYDVYEFKVTYVRITGRTAHVSTVFRFVGRPASEGKVARLEIQAGTEDELVKTSKGWRFLTIRDTRP